MKLRKVSSARAYEEGDPEEYGSVEPKKSLSPGIAPLAWKVGCFQALVMENGHAEPRPLEVRGSTSGPFGVFRGDNRGPRESLFSLVHLPTSRFIATLKYRRECMALAAELATLRAAWDETDPQKVVGGAPDIEKVQEIVARFKARAW